MLPAIAVAFLAAWSPVNAAEVRLGAVVTNMELWVGVFPRPDTFSPVNLDSIQGQIYFELPDAEVVRFLLNPRLEFGGLLNLAGRESYAYGGLGWQFPILDGPFFLEAGMGGAVHNGSVAGAVPPLRDLGCPFAFHYSYGVGANLTDAFTLSARFQHISNFYLCPGPNQGLNSVALSVGYKF
jgi:hypothetical protein